MSNSSFVDVKIMGREYRVACPSEADRSLLMQAVERVDQKMNDIVSKSRSAGNIERIAVMTALNIAHESLTTALPADDATALNEAEKKPESTFDIEDAKRRMSNMKAILDEVLASSNPVVAES